MMFKLLFISALFVGASFLSSCGSAASSSKGKQPAATRQTTARTFERHDPATPFLAVRVFYADAANVRRLVDLQDDQAEKFRGMRRVGDGILSVGIKDGRGRWLDSYECGGFLFVSAAAGQACQIVVRNESKRRLEVLAGMDGKDVIAGGTFTLEHQGIVLAPGQTSVIGAVKRRQLARLSFGTGRPVSAGPVVERGFTPSPGSIILAVFHEKDHFPWEGTRSMPRAGYTPGKQPQRPFEPEAPTHEYR